MYSFLNIKFEQLTEKELNAAKKKIKSRKTASFKEDPPKIWKTRRFDDILL